MICLAGKRSIDTGPLKLYIISKLGSNRQRLKNSLIPRREEDDFADIQQYGYCKGNINIYKENV